MKKNIFITFLFFLYSFGIAQNLQISIDQPLPVCNVGTYHFLFAFTAQTIPLF